MSIEELESALKRRGYTLTRHPIRFYEYEVFRFDENQSCMAFSKAAIQRLPDAEIFQFIDGIAGAGQHHMQHDCGYPLLREFKNTGNHETLAYRDAKQGPESKPLLECPQCWQYVQDDSVREIEDKGER